MGSPLLTYQQIADSTQCSVSNVRKWVASRQLKAVKLGHRIRRVKQAEFDAFIKRRSTR